jgi:hypothetical protein
MSSPSLRSLSARRSTPRGVRDPLPDEAAPLPVQPPGLLLLGGRDPHEAPHAPVTARVGHEGPQQGAGVDPAGVDGPRASMCLVGVVRTPEGAVHDDDRHDRAGHREDRLSGPWRRREWQGGAQSPSEKELNRFKPLRGDG